jgi:hypothetical protein
MSELLLARMVFPGILLLWGISWTALCAVRTLLVTPIIYSPCFSLSLYQLVRPLVFLGLFLIAFLPGLNSCCRQAHTYRARLLHRRGTNVAFGYNRMIYIILYMYPHAGRGGEFCFLICSLPRGLIYAYYKITLFLCTNLICFCSL